MYGVAPRARWIAGVVWCVVGLACSRTPVLRSLRGESPFDTNTDVDTATLVAAWDECVRRGLHEGLDDDSWRCRSVYEEIEARRSALVWSMYGVPLADADSCEQAVALVAVAEESLGPLRSISRWTSGARAKDEGVIPAWSRLHAIRTGRFEDVVSALPTDEILTHGKMLLECGAGDELARLLEVYEADRRASPSPPASTESVVAQLVSSSLREASALVARGEAPPLVEAAVRTRPAPAPCPADADAVLALLRDPDADQRILGCDCVDVVVAEARAEAVRLRRDLVDHDPEHASVTAARSADRDAIRPVDGPAAVPLAVPILVGGVMRELAGPRHEDVYPVREACARASPPWETRGDAPTPHRGDP